MSKAENFTVRLDGELKQRMKAHPEINWSHVIREHIRSMLDDIERLNELAAESELTDTDVEEVAAAIDAAAVDRARDDLTEHDPDTDVLNESDETERSSIREDVDA